MSVTDLVASIRDRQCIRSMSVVNVWSKRYSSQIDKGIDV